MLRYPGRTCEIGGIRPNIVTQFVFEKKYVFELVFSFVHIKKIEMNELSQAGSVEGM